MFDQKPSNYRVTQIFDNYYIIQEGVKNPFTVLPFITISIPPYLNWVDSIYDSEATLAKLLSVSVCLDLMPERSIADVFNDGNGRFKYILPVLLQTQSKVN